MDLKLPSESTKSSNIFSLYVNGNSGQSNERILALSIQPYQSTLMLMMTYSFNNSQSYIYEIRKKVNAGNWFNLKLSQLNGSYEINVDYELVYNRTNFTPKTWTSVILGIGNFNGNGNISTIVHYRNFKINTCKTKGKIQKEYLSFTVLCSSAELRP